MRSKFEDFRVSFALMAPQSIISGEELAILLATSKAAVAQMSYRGELPQKAFPKKRRACWFVRDIRSWLDDQKNCAVTPKSSPESDKKWGRPRKIE